MRFEWEPKIWDPMAPSANIKPAFSSPPGSLPPWLNWEDGVRLTGVPDKPSPPIHVQATAEFIDGAGNSASLSTGFVIQVVNLPQPISNAEAAAAAAYPPPPMGQWLPADFGQDVSIDMTAVQPQ